MKDRICPFMTRPKKYTGSIESGYIYCQKEKCMAWGVTHKQVKTDGFKGNFVEIMGCKLIDRGETA